MAVNTFTSGKDDQPVPSRPRAEAFHAARSATLLSVVAERMRKPSTPAEA